MKISIIFCFIFLCIYCCSCNDDDDEQSEKNYIEISFNGENVSGYTSKGPSYASEDEIYKEKPGIFDQISNVSTSNYTFLFSLYHYINFNDFESSQIGMYSICDTCTNASNLDALVYLRDNTESNGLTSLMSGAKNKVLEIKNLGDEIPSPYVNGSIKYRIKGELNNMIFRNEGNEDIVVSAKYEAYISVVK